MLSTHLPPQTWKPLLHIRPHAPPMQAPAPLGSDGQFVHAVPHPVGSLSGAQRVPQRWVPAPHVKSHAVPSHEVALAPVGRGHARHDVPQLLTLVFDAQMPPQSCEPAAHCPEHAAAMAMHAPAHSFMPAGQAGTHAVPSHVTVPPPVGASQATHEVAPQLPMAMLLTQRPPQR